MSEKMAAAFARSSGVCMYSMGRSFRFVGVEGFRFYRHGLARHFRGALLLASAGLPRPAFRGAGRAFFRVLMMRSVGCAVVEKNG